MKSQSQSHAQPAGSGAGGSHVLLQGSRREMRPGAQVLGVADPDEWLELTIKLKRKKPLPEPGAAGVKPLSRTELEAQYGADPADVEKVKTVLTGLGMRILKEQTGACTIHAGGTASVVESIFLVKLFHYSHPKGNYR